MLVSRPAGGWRQSGALDGTSSVRVVALNATGGAERQRARSARFHRVDGGRAGASSLEDGAARDPARRSRQQPFWPQPSRCETVAFSATGVD